MGCKKEREKSYTIQAKRDMNVTHHPPGLVLTDHSFDLPLDHSKPDGPTLF